MSTAALAAIRPATASPTDPMMTALPTRDTTAPERRGGATNVDVDAATGAAGFGIPIDLPAGRLGMEPQLALHYSSTGSLRGGVAVGWDLSLATIERDPDVVDGVAYMAMGQRLIGLGGNRYRAERDAAFVRYEYVPAFDRWTANTLDGRTRTFEHGLQGTRWHLTRETDGFGNQVDYTYAQQVVGSYREWVPTRIEYTSNPGFGLGPHARVDFVHTPLETCGGIPIGAAVDAHFGVPRITGSRRLSEVRVSVRDEQTSSWRVARQYLLAYDDAERTCQRSALRYLSAVTVVAYSRQGLPTVAPPTTFAYGPTARTLERTLALPSFGGGERGTSAGPTAMLADFDGDGWIDRIEMRVDDGCRLAVTRGTGIGTFASQAVEIDLPSAPWYDGVAPAPGGVENCTLLGQTVFRGHSREGAACRMDSATVSYDLLDWDGDGLLDVVSMLHETRKGIAGGDFTLSTAREDNGDSPCSSSCPSGMEYSGCSEDKTTAICSCPPNEVYDGAECVPPQCAEGTTWDPVAQACIGRECTGASCFPGETPPQSPPTSSGGCPLVSPAPEADGTGGYRIYVQRNLGAGGVESFAAALRVSSPVPLPPNPSLVNVETVVLPGVPALFDVNGDGLLDVLSLDNPPTLEPLVAPVLGAEPTLYVWPGTGQGSFGSVQSWSLPTWSQAPSGPTWSTTGRLVTTTAFLVRDLDGDRLSDLIAQRPDGTLVAMQNRGGSFAPPISLGISGPLDATRVETTPALVAPASIRTGVYTSTHQVVDIDDDGLPEHLVFVTNDSTAALDASSRVAFQLGGGTMYGARNLPSAWEALERRVSILDGLWYRASDTIDVTGDGVPDLVTWDSRALPPAPPALDAIGDPDAVASGGATVRTDAAGPPLRALVSIDAHRGTVTRIEYASSTDPAVLDIRDGHLAPRQLVRRIRVETVGAVPQVTSYRYAAPAHGRDSARARTPRFLGFSEVTIERSGSLGDQSERTVTTYDVTPIGADGTPRALETWRYARQADGSYAAIERSSRTWRNLSMFDWSGVSLTVAEAERMETCSANATLDSCLLAPASWVTTTETWQPVVNGAGQIEHYQHVRTRATGSDVAEARVATRRYEVYTINGQRRQVLAEETRGSDTAVLARTVQHFDANLLPVETHHDRGPGDVAITRRGFDQRGNLVWSMKASEVAATQRIAMFAYDTHQLTPRITWNELGHHVTSTTDIATGQVIETLGPNIDDYSHREIDGFGRVLSVSRPTAPDGVIRVVERTRYVDGEPTRVIHDVVQDHATGARVTDETVYDGLGRVVQQIARRQLSGEPDATTSYAYDSRGALATVTAPTPDGATSTFSWSRDALGRPTATTRPDGGGVEARYDGRTTTIVERTPLATTTVLHVDAFGQLRTVQERPTPTPTRYDYDAAGRMTSIVDAAGLVTQLGYDQRGNRTSIERAGRVWRYAYTLDDQLEMVEAPVPAGEDAEKFRTYHKYDALGREIAVLPARRTLDDSEMNRLGIGPTTWEFDTHRIGSLATIKLPFGSIEHAVDVEGRLVRETRQIAVPGSNLVIAQKVQRTYDARGAVRSVTWDDDTTWEYAYDARGRVSTVTLGDGRVLAKYRRGLDGSPVERMGLGQRRWWKYDVLGRPTYDQISSIDKGTVFGERSYGYDGDELVAVWGQTGGLAADATYEYDARHRVTGAVGPLTYTAQLAYSPTGNITSAAVFGALDVPDRKVAYRYSAQDPQAVEALLDAGGDAVARLAYDLSGNAIERATPDGRLALTWDGEDRLREVTHERTGSEHYLFAPGGERVAAIGQNGIRVWFAESETLFALDGTQLRREHRVATHEPVATIVDGRTVELQYADALGNLMLAIDEVGRVQAAFLYGAFGELVAGDAAGSRRRLFNGKEHDVASGLRHYGFRSYDPLTLRWTSADPMYRFMPDAAWTEPQRANLYAFSLNNPLRYLDPNGLDGCANHPEDCQDAPTEMNSKVARGHYNEIFTPHSKGIVYVLDVADDVGDMAKRNKREDYGEPRLVAGYQGTMLGLLENFAEPDQEVDDMRRAGYTVLWLHDVSWADFKAILADDRTVGVILDAHGNHGSIEFAGGVWRHGHHGDFAQLKPGPNLRFGLFVTCELGYAETELKQALPGVNLYGLTKSTTGWQQYHFNRKLSSILKRELGVTPYYERSMVSDALRYMNQQVERWFSD